MWHGGAVGRVPAAGRPQALQLGFHLEPGMRVGLYGGSFNPVHDGHVQVARTALSRLGLDRLIWLVTPGNPLKTSQPEQDLHARIAAVEARAGHGMIVSGMEAALGSSFSVDTLRVLKARYPRVRFVWVMGADNLAAFHRWRGWSLMLRQVPIAVVARPGETLPALTSPAARRFAKARRPTRQARRLALMSPPAWIYLPMPLNPLSSTAIRLRANWRREREQPPANSL